MLGNTTVRICAKVMMFAGLVSCVQRLSTSSPPSQCTSAHPQRYVRRSIVSFQHLTTTHACLSIRSKPSYALHYSTLPIYMQGSMASSSAPAAAATQVAGPSKNPQAPSSLKVGGGPPPLAAGKSSKAAIKVSTQSDRSLCFCRLRTPRSCHV